MGQAMRTKTVRPDRPFRRHAILMFLGLGFVLVLGGLVACSGTRVYETTYRGTPVEAWPGDSVDWEPAIYWVGGGEGLALVTFGSSSCPKAPTSVEVTSPTELVVEIAQTGGFFCTADMSAQTYELRPPPGLDPASDITVDLGPGTVRTLTPPRG